MALKRTRTEEPGNGYDNQFSSTSVAKLYLEAELADVYFVFGDSDNCERVPAHKNILAVGSDVFKAMFYGELKEKGGVKITDASADAFKEFLQFFYRIKVNLTLENAFDVVNLCKKYDVAACLNICDRFLKDEITLNNDSVCSIYRLAILFELEDLTNFCEPKIVENTEAVFRSPSFLHCDRTVLSRILKLGALSCSEVKVFHACMNWINAKAKQEEVTIELVQAHLGDLFYEIRSGSMTMEEFLGLKTSYGKLFSYDEYQEIVQMIGLKDFQPKIFKRNPRHSHVPQWNHDAVIDCDRRINFRYNNHNKVSLKSEEKTTFIVNTPVLLGEILCMRLCSMGIPSTNDNCIKAEMTINEISSHVAPKVLYNQQNLQLSLNNISVKRLTKPILVKPGLKYEIHLNLLYSPANQEIYYTSLRLKDRVKLAGSDIIIQFVGEDKERGIVEVLRFNPISKA